MQRLTVHFLKTSPSPKKLFFIFFPVFCCCLKLGVFSRLHSFPVFEPVFERDLELWFDFTEQLSTYLFSLFSMLETVSSLFISIISFLHAFGSISFSLFSLVDISCEGFLMLVELIIMFSSSSIFTISSFNGMFKRILICLIFSISWEFFKRIYFTRSITAL